MLELRDIHFSFCPSEDYCHFTLLVTNSPDNGRAEQKEEALIKYSNQFIIELVFVDLLSADYFELK